ncbi:MAG: hypothetical protein K6D95_00120 [Treponema sp.]|nr:hypothetical protein [Treponema sp.]
MYTEEEKDAEIWGDSLDECKRKLQEMYGKNWRPKDIRTETVRYGLLGLRKKFQKVLTYTVIDHNIYSSQEKQEPVLSAAEQFEKNKQEILKNNNDILIKKTLENLNSQVANVNAKLDSLNSATSYKHETVRKIEELLAENEFTYSYIQMISEKILQSFTNPQLDDYYLVQRYVIDWIGESISITKEKAFRPPHVIIIVGPTGVGKTTTLAKLASNTILDAKANNKPKPEICFITTDTMRVGALEQISKFGEILGKNVMKAESSNDVLKNFEEYKDHVDYIFIDTSGYSPNDSTNIAKMKNILNVDGLHADIYLSFAASTKASDIANILRNYEPLGYESIIITKADETKQLGNVISVLYEKHKSISYITNGQGVPKNIMRANVIEFIKNLNGFDVDRVHIEDKFGEE